MQAFLLMHIAYAQTSMHFYRIARTFLHTACHSITPSSTSQIIACALPAEHAPMHAPGSSCIER